MRRNKDYKEWSVNIHVADDILSNMEKSLNATGFTIGELATLLCANGINSEELYDCYSKILDVCVIISHFRVNDINHARNEARTKHKLRNKGF